MRDIQTLLVVVASLLQCSCVTTEPVSVVPHINVSPADVTLDAPLEERTVTIGLAAEANESDSLERLEVLPGVRVASVEPTGAAAAAGVRVADVILSAADVATDDPVALAAVLRGASAGDPLALEVRRGTVVFEATVVPRSLPTTAPPPRELYRVDPVRTRAGFRTEVVVAGEERTAAAILVEVFDGSPLPGAGFEVGDAVLRLDGTPIASAHDLVRRLIEEREPGDTVVLDRSRNGEVQRMRVGLWEPRRRVSRMALLPLFRYENDLEPSRSEFTLLDLWLFSLFSYHRSGGEREYRILTLIRFGSGHGELIEETPSPQEDAP